MSTPVVKEESVVVEYLKHFAILAALGAASVIIVALIQLAGSFNVSSLPFVWQGFAFLVLPVIVSAGLRVKTEIDAQLAAELAAKSLAKEQAKNLILTKQMVELKGMNADDSGFHTF